MSPLLGCSVHSRQLSTSAAAPHSTLAGSLKRNEPVSITTVGPGSHLLIPWGDLSQSCEAEVGSKTKSTALRSFQICHFNRNCLW